MKFSVAEALRQHGDAYLEAFGKAMPQEHKRVLSLIRRCRTGELGHVVKQCDTCPNKHWFGRSCGNRHCPNCQSDKSSLWLARRMAQRLPVTHYMVTFTVPGKLRKVVRRKKRVGAAVVEFAFVAPLIVVHVPLVPFLNCQIYWLLPPLCPLGPALFVILLRS